MALSRSAWVTFNTRQVNEMTATVDQQEEIKPNEVPWPGNGLRSYGKLRSSNITETHGCVPLKGTGVCTWPSQF